MEADFDKLKPQCVINVVSGYDGGRIKNPAYEQVSAGITHYRELIEVTYDTSKISYTQLVKYFSLMLIQRCTMTNFATMLISTPQRFIILTLNKNKLPNKLKYISIRCQTKLFILLSPPTTHFYPDESYHQDYYHKNSLRYNLYRWNCGRDKRVHAILYSHRDQLQRLATQTHH